MPLQGRLLIIALAVGLALVSKPENGVSSPRPIAAAAAAHENLAFALGVVIAAKPENGMSSPRPTTASVVDDENYCWFCWKYEDLRYNLLTEQYEYVTVAVCVTEDNKAQGAEICNTPSNQFDYEGVYHGGHCTMYKHIEGPGWAACNCLYVNQGGMDELWADDCNYESPAAALSFDGYMAESNIGLHNNEDEDYSASSCKGVLTERSLGRHEAAVAYRKLEKLVV